MICVICKGECVTRFLSLGDQPPSDAFLKPDDLHKPEATYPLELFFCETCTLVQLGYAVDPDILFRDYVYTSGTNNSLRANFKSLVETIIQKYKIVKGDFVVDVGSNDGTLLANYLPYGISVLGIDPSSAALLAQEKNVPTLNDYFNEETAKVVREKYGGAKIITATNVFAHVVALDSFMRGILTLLDDKGVFVSESGYVVDMVEGLQYDSIYHEHLRYYSVTSLVSLFAQFGMEIIDIERIPIHGGSLRVSAARKGVYPVETSVASLVALEKERGYTTISIYRTFAEDVARTRDKLLDIVSSLKQEGARIVGIGAPAKGNTLLNYCRLDTHMIEYLTEKSPLKIGLYSPGMHIPVVDEAQLFEDNPEAAILLSWNIAEELKKKLRQNGYRGKFIVPNPVPRVLPD